MPTKTGKPHPFIGKTCLCHGCSSCSSWASLQHDLWLSVCTDIGFKSPRFTPCRIFLVADKTAPGENEPFQGFTALFGPIWSGPVMMGGPCKSRHVVPPDRCPLVTRRATEEGLPAEQSAVSAPAINGVHYLCVPGVEKQVV